MNTLKKIKSWLLENKYDGVLLTRRDNFAWVTGGRRNHVVQNQETGAASLLITPDEDFLFADSIDAQRIFEEETDFPVSLKVHPWFESREPFIRSCIGKSIIVSDTGAAGTKNVQEQLIDLRLTLNPQEEAEYYALGQECAEIVEAVCMDVRPGWTENRAAQILKSRCIQAGISPDCVLAGSDGRIEKYRHPMPTEREIDKKFMLVLGGERHGLNVSITRLVHFGELPLELQKKHSLNQKIFAGMQGMTVDGITYRDFFSKMKDLYAAAGYSDEWMKHHQGGPTGYACREKIITPDTAGKISMHQAFAWNPTITGTKCEETTLLTENGISILTRTKKWPVTEFETANGIITAADILIQ